MTNRKRNNRNFRRSNNRNGRKVRRNFRGDKTKNNRLVRLTQQGRFAPDRTFVNLVYNDTTLIRNVSSSGSMNWGYRSSAYDPDPAVLSGAIPGFVELANLYTMYRVHSMKIQITIGNQELQNLVLAVWPSTTLQNTNSLNSDDIMEFGANLRAKTMVIGPSTGSTVKFIQTTALAKSLIGPQYKYDLSYASLTSNNPTEMFFINIGLVNPVQNFDFGVVARVKIIYEIELFRLRQLQT